MTVTPLGSPDSFLLLSAGLFVGTGRQPIRARCGCNRYPFSLLGIAPAVVSRAFLSAWADSQCVPGAAIIVTPLGSPDSFLLLISFALKFRPLGRLFLLPQLSFKLQFISPLRRSRLASPFGGGAHRIFIFCGRRGLFYRFCPLSHALRRASSPTGRAKGAER